MADLAIEGALAQRKHLEEKVSECEAKIKRLRAQLAETNKFIAQWEKFSGKSAFDFGGGSSPMATANLSQNETDSPLSTRARNPKKEKVAEAVVEILRQHNKPMMRADIFKALEQRGIHISGTDPEMVLSTMLWRAGESFRIARLKGGGYWFSDRPIPADDPPPPNSETEYGETRAVSDEDSLFE